MNTTLEHLTQLMNDRGWSLNLLATKADMPQSTLSGLYQRNNVPSLPTLEKSPAPPLASPCPSSLRLQAS